MTKVLFLELFQKFECSVLILGLDTRLKRGRPTLVVFRRGRLLNVLF